MIEPLVVPFAAIFALALLYFMFVPQKGEAPLSAEAARRRRKLRWCGVAFLAAGCLCAPGVYFSAPPPPAPISGPYAPMETKKQREQTEILVGKAGFLASDFSDWVKARFHGRGLAGTILAVAGAGFVVCFVLARLEGYPEHRP